MLGPDGRAADGAVVTLLDPLGTELASTTVSDGTFTLADVPPGTYALRAEAPPLQAGIQEIAVTTAIPVRVEMTLSAVASDQVVVHGESPPPGTTSRVTLGGDAVRRAPARLRSRAVQDAIATAPGWATEDNGLLHVRGVDDGFLYVIDGVPVYERLDGVFGMPPDPASIESLNVVTGYIPPEFGWKAGGVLEVRSAARAGNEWAGAVEVAAGADATLGFSGIAGGPAGTASALTVGLSRQSSSRFLDPVHPDNFHNEGRSWSGSGQFGLHASPSDAVNLTGGFARSDFDVPHQQDQEAAGQDQRQRIRQYSQSASWQRTWTSRTVLHVAQYARYGTSGLDGSASDVPLLVEARRTLGRYGVLAAVSHSRGRHLIKAGAEASALRLHEDFTFAVTDLEMAGDAGISDEAGAFTPGSPFVFRGRARPSLFSAFVQDSVRVGANLTLDGGIRVDWSRLLRRASQVSPRVGAAYRVPAAGTTMRASYGRFFQPPQPENLLLASSRSAWELSPFRDETGGGRELAPERQHAFEMGVHQPLGRRLRVDAAYWRRRMTDVADPNVFFGTTILFPNSVARGRASGVEVRIEVPSHLGWSAYVSYANSRVVQFGPIAGGLFLEDEVIEIGPGRPFTPDHDQRNVGSFGITYDAAPRGSRVWVTGRHESGTPLEVGDGELDELRERPGADLVDFDRGRVKPRTVFDIAASQRLFRGGGVEVHLRASVLNLTGRRWAYNFGNPFSGTHFGPGRTMQAGIGVEFD